MLDDDDVLRYMQRYY